MNQSKANLLAQQLNNPLSTFSIGAFGAIAEFNRDLAEKTTIRSESPSSIVTDRGALSIESIEQAQPIAYENLSKHPKMWRSGIVFCLPYTVGKSKKRGVLTELGPDWYAIRSKDRGATLFDVGLGTTNIDFCIRTTNEELLDILRGAEGSSILEPDNPVMGKIIAESPHRVAISKLGRIEVFQRIPTDQTPEGPHTHVLPKLLRTGRTHSANVPVPKGYLPCFSCYPANPLYDRLGNETPFDHKKFHDFIVILEKWGLPDYLEEKKRALNAIQNSVTPAKYSQPETRLGRTALRVTLRQLFCQNPNSSLLEEWRYRFDSIDNNQEN